MLTYEGVVLENPYLSMEWSGLKIRKALPCSIEAPHGVTSGVPSDVYGQYRLGRDSACVDIVLVTRLEDGTPAVLLSLRNPTVCFGNKWWIYGGALQAYMSIEEFISGRATKECGIEVKPEALIGVDRTMADDYIGSTLQPCYVARVPIEVIRAKMNTDEGHAEVQLFTAFELNAISPAQFHWYPQRVAKLALANIPR